MWWPGLRLWSDKLHSPHQEDVELSDKSSVANRMYNTFLSKLIDYKSKVSVNVLSTPVVDFPLHVVTLNIVITYISRSKPDDIGTSPL